MELRLFTSRLQDRSVEIVSEVESGGDQAVEEGTERGNKPAVFGMNQEAKKSKDAVIFGFRYSASRSIIEDHEVGMEFPGQGDGFSLSSAKPVPKPFNRVTIPNLVPDDPLCLLDHLTIRSALSGENNFIIHSLRHMNRTGELPQ